MPRIRCLKPDAPQHRKVGRLSDRAFRLWITMLLQADDAGRLVADVNQLRLLAFGYQPRLRAEQVATTVAELARSGLIRLYQVDDSQYADFPSWSHHQRIQHPSESRLPEYRPDLAVPLADSGKAHEDSGKAHEASPSRARGWKGLKGREGMEGGETSGTLRNGLPSWIASLPFPEIPAAWWRQTLALFPGLDHEAVARDAAAYWTDHRGKYRDVAKFLRHQFARAFERRKTTTAPDPYAHLPAAWSCSTCGDVHEGPRDGPRICPRSAGA